MTTALLFDLDGTLIDSDPLHAAIFIEMFADRGRTIDFEFYRTQIHGRLNAHIFGDLFPGEDAEALSVAKEAAYRNLLHDGMEPIAGVRDLMEMARRNGWPVAVVTNAPRENGEAVVETLGLADCVDTLVIGDECSQAKPDPAPYAEGLRRLGADAAASLAFEDSPSGIRSAVGAGIKTLGVRSLLDETTLQAAGAAATIADYTDPALAPHIDQLRGIAA